MSAEQTPSYHYPDHLRAYDVDSPRRSWGQIHMLMEMMDSILYAGGTSIQPTQASASERIFESHFSYRYPRSEVSVTGLSMAPEFMTLNIDHTRYLGSAALKQSYKVKTNSNVRHLQQWRNRISTIFDFDEVAGGENQYSGTIIRPHIVPGALGHPITTDELVTVYDCENLSHTLNEVLVLIQEDKEHQASKA